MPVATIRERLERPRVTAHVASRSSGSLSCLAVCLTSGGHRRAFTKTVDRSLTPNAAVLRSVQLAVARVTMPSIMEVRHNSHFAWLGSRVFHRRRADGWSGSTIANEWQAVRDLIEAGSHVLSWTYINGATSYLSRTVEERYGDTVREMTYFTENGPRGVPTDEDLKVDEAARRGLARTMATLERVSATGIRPF
jgi:hypothetical protein